MMVLILAAGKGTRMKSDTPKVLFKAAGLPMIDHVVKTAKAVGADDINVVIGNGAELVREHLKDTVSFSVQTEQRGTGDAVLAAADAVKRSDKTLILCGDMPLVKAETLAEFIKQAKDEPVAFISVKVKNPKGYGRVIRGIDGNVIKIVEEKDATEDEKREDEINTGIYLCDSAEMMSRLNGIGCDNAQGEYYLTDIIKKGVSAYQAEDEQEFLGVNNRSQLAEASAVLRDRIATEHMMNGVTLIDPKTFYCDHTVVIEKDVTIYPNVYLEGKTVVRKGTVIYSGSRVIDSEIAENCVVKDNTVIEESIVGAKSQVGPMAHLRPGAKLAGENKVGNFVELKKASLGFGSKSSHLTYLGDCEIGSDVNVGCGTITCNYDGYHKFKTVIGDRVFVGSDVQFVAPITVGDDALIAAGSTITKDVPEGALGITRAKQQNLEGWVASWKAKKGVK